MGKIKQLDEIQNLIEQLNETDTGIWSCVDMASDLPISLPKVSIIHEVYGIPSIVYHGSQSPAQTFLAGVVYAFIFSEVI